MDNILPAYQDAEANGASSVNLLKAAELATGYTGRKLELFFYNLVLTGKHYDLLEYQYNQTSGSMGRIPIHSRAPSVKYNLCSKVAEDSAGLLFGDSHFPIIHVEDKETREVIQLIKREAKLPLTMLEAATFGSIGSVAILVGVVNEQLFFKTLKTIDLIPKFDNDKTQNLVSVVQEKIIKGKTLISYGYNIEKIYYEEDFLLIREWNKEAEIVYVPILSREYNVKKLRIDKERSTKHNLGFVPIVWIKNLPSENLIDGDCTFRKAIDISIQIDYLLSQGGRGLFYSAEPTLVLKKPNIPMGSNITYGGGNVIDLPPDGDAKLLELTGGAVQAIENYAKMLREFALEVIHGDRADTNKLSVAQSGKAMEVMLQDLIWLSDKLRIVYGEVALVKLIYMTLAVINKTKVKVLGTYLRKVKEDENITLIWTNWFSPTPDDVQKLSVGYSNLYNNGLLSRSTIVNNEASIFDIEDSNQEITKIKGDQNERQRQQQQQQSRTTAATGGDKAGSASGEIKGQKITGDQPSKAQ